MSKLDDILATDPMLKIVMRMKNSAGTKPEEISLPWQTYQLLPSEKTKQQIKSLILELIGPGESLTEEQIANGRIYKFCDPQGDAVDRYKDGLRKKVEEL